MSTELEVGYLVSVTCRSPDEAHIRALLLQGLAGSGLALRRLDSNDLEGSGRVVVTALTTASQRLDADVEKIVGRLSLEQTVSAARWQADVQIASERSSPLEFSDSESRPNRDATKPMISSVAPALLSASTTNCGKVGTVIGDSPHVPKGAPALRKPVSTFRDHALVPTARGQACDAARKKGDIIFDHSKG
jgi:hypothetical protein